MTELMLKATMKTIECTTHGEAFAAIKWSREKFEGCDAHIRSWSWHKLPGYCGRDRDYEEYFPMFYVGEEFGTKSMIDILQYRAYFKKLESYQSIIFDLIFNASEIRHKNINSQNSSDVLFHRDYEFYTRIKNSLGNKSDLEKIRDELNIICNECHWPHFFRTMNGLKALVRIALNESYKLRPDSAWDIINEIIYAYPSSSETAKEYEAYLHSLCDNVPFNLCLETGDKYY